ncbi:MAG TPA: DUF4339 domain-containing protein [Gemmataceae bacterium]|nr:DUF4339 domain-containing protein [Gemmataceae bacterium]
MDAEWYFAEKGQQHGPVTFDELRERAAAGLLQPSDLIWKTGLADWQPASSQPGLFSAAAPPAAPAPRLYGDRAERDDELDYARPRQRAVSGKTWRVTLFTGGALLLGGLLCCGVIGVIVFAVKEPPNERSWRLDTNQSVFWPIPFHQGDKVVITVTSAGNSDMDLFVFTDKNKMDVFMKAKNLDTAARELCLRYDTELDKNCRVEFLAPQTQEYWVLLINRNSDEPARNSKNSGKLVFEPVPK